MGWAQLRTRNHETTKGGGAGGALPRCAGVIVGSASADREIAKPRKNSETTEAPARATAHKNKRSKPPRIRSLPANGAFRGFRVLSRFRDAANAHPTLTPRPTHRKPAHHRARSFFVFSCAALCRACPRQPSRTMRPGRMEKQRGPDQGPRTACCVRQLTLQRCCRSSPSPDAGRTYSDTGRSARR